MPYVQDFQALHSLRDRYLAALALPTEIKPETACRALETMTVRLTTFIMRDAASSRDLIVISCFALPAPFNKKNVNVKVPR